MSKNDITVNLNGKRETEAVPRRRMSVVRQETIENMNYISKFLDDVRKRCYEDEVNGERSLREVAIILSSRLEDAGDLYTLDQIIESIRNRLEGQRKEIFSYMHTKRGDE